MKPIKTIETEIWEPNPEKKGLLRFVKTRTAKEVFAELTTMLKERNLLPDEYLLLSYRLEDQNMPKDAEVIAYTRWGGNEGIYIDVEIRTREGLTHFATGKTLDESSEAYDRMQYIAGVIYKAFNSEGVNYTDRHLAGGAGTVKQKLAAAFFELAQRVVYNDMPGGIFVKEIDEWLKLTEAQKNGEDIDLERINDLAKAIIEKKKEE